jgi:hypothetical protein
MTTMSTGERWMYRVIALSLFVLFVLIVIQHKPTGG